MAAPLAGTNFLFPLIFFFPSHYVSEIIEIGTLVFGHSLVRSLVRSHRSLVRAPARGTVEYFCPIFNVL